MHLSYETAYALMTNIDQYCAADFDALGISEKDFETLSQPQMWQLPQRRIVLRTMDALIFGTLEIMGLPKIIVPSEYIAPIIATIVAPVNRQACCVYMAQERSTGAGAMEMAARATVIGSVDHTSADKLFALVCLLSDTDRSNAARRLFIEKLTGAVKNAIDVTPKVKAVSK